MAQPGMPGSQFPGEDAMGRRLKDLERIVQQLAAANQLATAGIKAVPDGIVVEGSETVNGPLVVNGTMDVAGDAEFTGNMSITGTLNLPAGIIGNDALTSPLEFETAGLSENNFSVPSGGAVYATASIPVPAGYTRADVTCMVVAGAVNGTGSADYIYVSAYIDGAPGGETPQIASAGGYASAAANAIRSLTGLSGGFITVGTRVRAAGSWAAHAASIANTNAIVYFRR